jgi:DNA-binding transcriptional ArsR family regulator
MDVFSAIADPSRRQVLEILAEGERPAGDLVKALPGLSQPAVSRNLRVLREANLVEVRPRAQQRIYALRPEALRELDEWVARYRHFWSQKLGALSEHLDRRHGAGRPTTAGKK